MPANASINGDGFRFYRFEPSQDPAQQAIMTRLGLTAEQRTEVTDVLSVTSIRRLNGVNFNLVGWMVANVVNLAMGQRKNTMPGPKGGAPKGYVKDGEFPGTFVTRLLETEGNSDEMAIVRRWLTQNADEPRDIAAVRGTTVHKLIEDGVSLTDCTPERIHAAIEAAWDDEKNKIKREITDGDITFVRFAMHQYWAMREQRPFVILAREPQVFNLTAGYAGSVDVLAWFLPEGESVDYWQRMADKGEVTQTTIEKVGGETVLGDWKTSANVYTDHVVQGTAYLAGEFVATDGVIDERVTDILRACRKIALIHIRPNGSEIDFVDFRADVLRGFLGSCAFARLVAKYPKPETLFTSSETYAADLEGIDE